MEFVESIAVILACVGGFLSLMIVTRL